MQKKSHLVIIPVYNEEDSVVQVFEELRSHYQGDILIIDDGSLDRSMERLKGIHCSHCKAITHRSNMGYGASLMSGFSYAIGAKYEFTITMDCDLQHEPKQIREFINGDAAIDILSGSRYLNLESASGTAPTDRVKINQQITKQINEITGYKLTDAFCGYKRYRTSMLSKMTLSENSYGFPLQLWLQAWKVKATVSEIAVPRIYTDAKRSFGPTLDNPKDRMEYYQRIISQGLATL